MKRLILVGIALVAVVILYTNHSAKAEQRPQPHAVVILEATTSVHGGMQIYIISRSNNAPEIPVNSELGETLAFLLDNGFSIAHEGALFYRATR